MDKVANIAGSFIVLLIVTTLVLPGRQTIGVSNSIFTGASKLAKTGLGQG